MRDTITLRQHWAEMPFHERQQAWSGFARRFIQNNGRGKRPNVWEISVDGDRVTTTHGVQGGALQTTNYQGKAKNAGRANAITAVQDALAEARRDIRKKWDFEGYDELWEERNIDLRNDNVSVAHLLGSLPGSFCLYKPENDFWDQKKLVAKAREGKVWYTLKRDGMAKLVVKDFYSNIQIFSRRARPYHKDEGPEELTDGTLNYTSVVPWSARFPHLMEAIQALNLPNGTMLAGELIHPREGGDNFAHMQSLTKSLTPQAIQDQQAKGHPFFYWWDMPFFEGEDWVSTKYALHRFHTMRRVWDAAPDVAKHWIVPLHIETFPSPEAALERAKELKIEGWVVVDPASIYGDKGWNLKGKPDRPSTCAKLKPTGEDDFVCYWDPENDVGEWGTGKHEKGKRVQLPNGQHVVHGGVGSVALYQYNNAGELLFISKCSSGMNYEFQAQLRKEHFPFVAQVEFKGRTFMSEGEKTNALRHPVFLRVRDDKAAPECRNDRL